MEIKQNILKNAFTNVAVPGSFTSAAKVQKALKTRGFKYSIKGIKKWLTSQDAYTLHRSRKRHFSRRPIQSFFPLQFVEIDLIDMQNIASYNDNVRYLLASICVFTKYAWIQPLTDKKMDTVTKTYQRHIEESGHIPLNLRFDKGSEFVNKKFKDLCNLYSINVFTANNDVKCATIERFIRTLRGKISKFLSFYNTKRYVDNLNDFVYSYNNTYHSSIKMSPHTAFTQASFSTIFKNQFKRSNFRIHIPKIQKKLQDIHVNDYVRISNIKNIFSKESEANFSIELFRVYKITYHYNEPVFHLEDWEGEAVVGTFSRHELQKVSVLNEKLFKIESILETKKMKGETWHLVKYLGYPPKFNKWIKRSDLYKI